MPNPYLLTNKGVGGKIYEMGELSKTESEIYNDIGREFIKFDEKQQ